MSLASLLKKGSLRGVATATPATPATHSPFRPRTVATVAVANPPDRAANDPNVKVTARVADAIDGEVTARATTETDRKVTARVEPGQDAKVMQRVEEASDPDRDCWPHSDAMNGGEIDTFTARLIRFTDKGLALDDGEALADQLVRRDRELDDRRLCLECTHLAGHTGTWRCRSWQRAGIARQARDAGLPGELVRTLQRCDGFTHSINT
jgi:hypothetical protein